MKEIRKEKVTKSEYFVYVANDGTEFSNHDECKKYEDSAKGVMMAKIKPLIVADISEEDILGFGIGDNTVWVMRPTSQEDADVILQAYILYNQYVTEDGHKHILETARALVQRAFDENDVIFVCRGYDMECFWFYGTRNSLKEKLDRFMKIEKKDDNA